LAYPPLLPTAEEGEKRHRALGDGVEGLIHPPDGRPYGRHATTIDSVEALFDNRPLQEGPRVTPILVVYDRRGRPRGRQEVGKDIVVDVLLGTQKVARPLGLTIDRHGGRSVRSPRRRHPAARGGEPGKIRTPYPWVGHTDTRS